VACSLTAAITAQATSLCRRKMSSSRRSKLCDQTWYPSCAPTICTSMRTVSACLRTPPSSSVATLSRRPISRTSSCLPLNANDELRAVTRSPGTRASWLRISSASPSEKYSLDGSSLRLANGSTAIERPGGPGGGATGSGGAPRASVRSMPCGVTSKIQASTSATGSPTASAAITYRV
jgi:hypothetical protein